MGDLSSRPQGRRRPRRKGRATKDAERRALAKAHASPARPVKRARPGFAVLHVDGGARGAPGPAAIGYVVEDEEGVRLAEHAHVNGERHIRNARLLELEGDIADRRMRSGTVLFEWIPATANGAAHQLVAGVLGSAES